MNHRTAGRGDPEPLSVLLVEDSADDASLIVAAFRSAGLDAHMVRVDNERDYRAALALRPDVIVSDLDLPSFSGLVALAIRHETAPDIPFIVVSGAVDDATAASVIAAGATDYLLKDRLHRIGAAVIRSVEARVSIEARERAEVTAAAVASRWEQLITHSTDVLGVVDSDGKIVFASRALATVLGHQVESVLDHTIFEYVHPDDRERAVELFAATLAHDGAALPVTIRVVTKSGDWRYLEALSNNRLSDPTIAGIVVNARDITERVEAQALLDDRAVIAEQIARDEPVACVLASIAAVALTPGSPGTVTFSIDHPLFQFNSRTLPQTPQDREVPIVVDGVKVGCMLMSGTDDRRTQLADGSRAARGAHLAALVVQREISKAKLAHEELHDPLTGLSNRRLLSERVVQALRRPGSMATLVVIGVDHFKLVNDGIGHAFGDGVLRTLASRFAKLTGPEDTLARLGGDEFAVLVHCAAVDLHVSRLTRSLLTSAQEAITLGDHELRVSVSIGIAEGVAGTLDAAALLGNADTALNNAKHAGRNRAVVFDAQSRGRIERRVALDQDLRAGIPRGELVAFLQPIINLATGQVEGAEGLVRWQHPIKGLLLPGDFVPWAEESDLIDTIDAWMVDAACRYLKSLATNSGLTISVNAAARELLDPTYATRTKATLRRHGVSPHSLALELTESVHLGDVDVVYANLAELHASGVRIYLDDFGTGYSSLSYLQRLPIDALKIDRAFVSTLPSDAKAVELVAAIVGLSRALRLTTIAEGVETSEQANSLLAMGVERAQGYLYSKPICIADFGVWLGERGAPAQTNRQLLPATVLPARRPQHSRRPFRDAEPVGTMEVTPPVQPAISSLSAPAASSRQSDLVLARFFDPTVDLLAVASFDGYFETLTPGWFPLLGYSEDELLSRPYIEFVHPDDRIATGAILANLVNENHLGIFDNRLMTSTGSFRWLRWKFRSDVGHRLVYAFAQDVTVEKLHAQLERARVAVGAALASSTHWDAAIDGVLEAICTQLDWCAGHRWSLADGRWSRLDPTKEASPTPARRDPNAARVHGEDLPARAARDGVPIICPNVVGADAFPHAPCRASSQLHDALAVAFSSERSGVAALCFLTPGAPSVDVGLGGFLQAVGLQLAHFARQLDAEEATRAALERGHASLEHRASHDGLTGLPNRQLMLDRADTAIQLAQRMKTNVAVMMIDLNDFKAINDTYGHEIGDDVLKEVGARLRASVRESDTVARRGGDEFTLLAAGDIDREGAQALAAKICAAFRTPIRAGAFDGVLGLSVGVAMYPAHGADTVDLLRCADVAMYASKASGIGWSYFVGAEREGRTRDRSRPPWSKSRGPGSVIAR